MLKTSAILLILTASATSLPAAAPAWDNSGNSLLSGDYYFREVLYIADATGYVSRALSLFGTISFHDGTYTLSGLGGADSTDSGYYGQPALSSGTAYTLSSSGFGGLSDPLVEGNSISILVSKGIILGSDTEAGYNSVFVAAPITSLSVGSFTGSYTISATEYFPGASVGTGSSYQLNPDGAGHLGSFNINGYISNGSAISQSAVNIPYKFSNNAAVITYPNNQNANFYSGQAFAYFSPDTNFIFGGMENGFDIFFGVKNAASGANTPLSGLYYEAGVEEYAGMDSFYGTFNATNGDIIGHERTYMPYLLPNAYGRTYPTTYPTSISRSYLDSSGSVQYTMGQNGFRLAYGTGGYLLASVAVPYTAPSTSDTVHIDPTGIVNSASSAPYTAGIAPGEFLTFYNGVNLAPSTTVSDTVPYPTDLNGVKVLFNDEKIAAPIYYVSPTQVSVIVPYDVSRYPVAKIQISNNGVLSNAVTTTVNQTAPGAFTSSPVGGIGVAALIDYPAAGGYYIVSDSRPAHPGDTVAAYLTGLGAPYPSNPAGAPGPAEGDSLLQPIYVDVNGEDVGTPSYAGLAPTLAGLYQINFKIPDDSTAGNASLGIFGADSYTTEAHIPIALSGSARPAPELQPQSARKLRPQPRR
jgi:uncharacterized protein (TIGR03437 family)